MMVEDLFKSGAVQSVSQSVWKKLAINPEILTKFKIGHFSLFERII
jgi:hypothetical protein